jgi:hypothetical protein
MRKSTMRACVYVGAVGVFLAGMALYVVHISDTVSFFGLLGGLTLALGGIMTCEILDEPEAN